MTIWFWTHPEPNLKTKEFWKLADDTYNAAQRRVLAEIARLWTSTQKNQDQLRNQDLLLSQFFQMAEKYPYTALLQTVDRWISESRWFPSAVKDFEDELKAAQDRVTPQLENHNDPWAKIRAGSPREWSSQLVKLYEEENRGLAEAGEGLSLKNRMVLQSQAMDMAFKNGAGSFGVHPHPTWSAQKCLHLTRYA
ncbi:MAG: hypothetical protein ACR2RF_06305 [Geminicoccaceae bacterium]